MKPEADIADPDLERGLIASLLADNSGLDKLGQLQPDDLCDPIHASILNAALDLRADRRPVTLVTLRRFATVPFDDESTVLDYIKRFEFAGSRPDVADIAARLHELAQRRQIKEMGEQIAGSVYDHAAKPSLLLTDAARAVDDLLAKCRPAGKTLHAMPEAVLDVLSASKDGDRDARIPIGFADLDRDTGGWRRGEYAILGGRTSMGKSTIAVAFARRVARAGHGVMVFSLEMTMRHWVTRTATDECWGRELVVPYAAALRGSLRERERNIFEAGANALADLPMLIEEQSGLTASDIAARTRNAAEVFQRQDKRLGLVIVDHLGKVRPSSRYRGQKVNEVGEVSEAMAHLAKSENVAVLCLHQLNRAVEGLDNKRPTLAHLRDTGNLEQDADMVMFAYRPAYYLERMKGETKQDEANRMAKLEEKRNVLEINIAKQRNGPTSTIELYCDMAANALRDKWRAAA